MINRTFGETLAISIGTAIPLEKLITDGIDGDYTHFYFNIKTLFRNLHGSFEKFHEPSAKHLAELLMEEITVIEGILTSSLSKQLTPVFYLPLCKDIRRQFKYAKIKEPRTTAQKNYEHLESRTITKLVKDMGDKIVLYNIKIHGNNTRSYMLSHLPLDLLSFRTFRVLTLIESHTGQTKDKLEWISKLKKDEGCSNIPFSALAIQVLGDNSHQFEGMGKKVIAELLDVAKKSRWTAMTSDPKMALDIKQNMSDKYGAEIFIAMLNVSIT